MLQPSEGWPVRIVADRATFWYEGALIPAICEVSFTVEPGECLLVVGASGSGKTTLGLALAGLVPVEVRGDWNGGLFLDDVDISAKQLRATMHRRIGLLFQDPDRQLVMERAGDDVAFGLENRGWDQLEMIARVPAALADVGLAGFERRRAAKLSGGERQRLALAGVLAPRPGLLILDEPTANLDWPSALALKEKLAEVRSTRSTTMVLIEHNVELAWPLADRVLALASDGSVLATGSPSEILRGYGEVLRRAGIWLPGEALVEDIRGSISRGATIVRAERISYGYVRRQRVLNDVSLQVAAGERVVLAGRNGSGKSTLGQLLVGLLRAESGRISLGGVDPSNVSAAKLARLTGYAFQDPERQFLTGSVDDEIRLGLRSDERRRIGDLMDRMQLPLGRFGARSPYQLSGGEQRRLSLACILIREPEFLFLDEPTFGQDRHGYETLLQILTELVAGGAGVMAATHDPRFAAQFGRRTVELVAGDLGSGSAA